jgi:hypothetical protein
LNLLNSSHNHRLDGWLLIRKRRFLDAIVHDSIIDDINESNNYRYSVNQRVDAERDSRDRQQIKRHRYCNQLRDARNFGGTPTSNTNMTDNKTADINIDKKDEPSHATSSASSSSSSSSLPLSSQEEEDNGGECLKYEKTKDISPHHYWDDEDSDGSLPNCYIPLIHLTTNYNI